MPKARARRLATPFVVTLAVSACTRSGGTNTPGPAPTGTSPEVPTPTATPPDPVATGTATPPPTSTVDTTDLVYDGTGSCYRMVDGKRSYVPACPDELLPAAKDGDPTFEYAGHCRTVPKPYPVRCPPGGTPLVLPARSNADNVFMNLADLSCRKSFPATHCPPGASCNPPPPQPVPCPQALLPSLAPGFSPTKRDGGRCYYGSVEVRCQGS
ncbi:MAG: hypothetical protein R3B13_29285 [Polyangiaceae bacterium]